MRLPWRRAMRNAVTAEPARHREADVSRQRQRRVREQVIGPLENRGERNEFAWLIAQSLIRDRRDGEDT